MQWMYMKYIDGFPFVSVTFPLNKPDGILIEDLELDYLIEYINKKQIEKAFVHGISKFDFLMKCQSLMHIGLELKLPFKSYGEVEIKGKKMYYEYDLNSLYHLVNLKSLYIIHNEIPDVVSKLRLDMRQLKSLEKYIGDYRYTDNLCDCKKLQSFSINHYNNIDLQYFSELKLLNTMEFSFSKLKSLRGIEGISKIQCLYLTYNRSLKDISALSEVKGTLRALRIENCPNIEDFSVLEELENLELLELWGKNSLPSLSFIKKMKNLKTFIFNMNVLDGDLTPCLNLSYVYSQVNRKHYNVKDYQMPRGLYVRGNEDIEEWRRLE